MRGQGGWDDWQQVRTSFSKKTGTPASRAHRMRPNIARFWPGLAPSVDLLREMYRVQEEVILLSCCGHKVGAQYSFLRTQTE